MVIWMENNLWEFVARECGLKVGLLASLKLTHIKYLKELDQWLLNEGFNDEKMENLEVSVVEKLDQLSRGDDVCLIANFFLGIPELYTDVQNIYDLIWFGVSL
ncbi:hypothetical protein HanIR_Chr04g0200851 [Helianthus annuus]|nr:hypothetical protein HanIR_Chr04g0200851 [Helianthus annuus]